MTKALWKKIPTSYILPNDQRTYEGILSLLLAHSCLAGQGT